MKRIVIILLLGVSVVFGESTKIKKEENIIKEIKKGNLIDIIKIDTVKKGLNENKDWNIYIYEKKDDRNIFEKYALIWNFVIALIVVVLTGRITNYYNLKKYKIEYGIKKCEKISELTAKHLGYWSALIKDEYRRKNQNAEVSESKEELLNENATKEEIEILIFGDDKYSEFKKLLEEVENNADRKSVV